MAGRRRGRHAPQSPDPPSDLPKAHTGRRRWRTPARATRCSGCASPRAALPLPRRRGAMLRRLPGPRSGVTGVRAWLLVLRAHMPGQACLPDSRASRAAHAVLYTQLQLGSSLKPSPTASSSLRQVVSRLARGWALAGLPDVDLTSTRLRRSRGLGARCGRAGHWQRRRRTRRQRCSRGRRRRGRRRRRRGRPAGAGRAVPGQCARACW